MWRNYWYTGGNAFDDDDGMIALDGETLEVVQVIDLDDRLAKGVSIDLDGNVWTTSYKSDSALRIDPDTGQIDIYSGLNKPYTYSDMTGWGLQNASCDPAG